MAEVCIGTQGSGSAGGGLGSGGGEGGGVRMGIRWPEWRSGGLGSKGTDGGSRGQQAQTGRGDPGPQSAVCTGCGSAINGARLAPALGLEALPGGPPRTSPYPLGPAPRMLGGAGSGHFGQGAPPLPFILPAPCSGVLVATAGPLGAPGWCPLSSTWKSFINVDGIKGGEANSLGLGGGSGV